MLAQRQWIPAKSSLNIGQVPGPIAAGRCVLRRIESGEFTLGLLRRRFIGKVSDQKLHVMELFRRLQSEISPNE